LTPVRTITRCGITVKELTSKQMALSVMPANAVHAVWMPQLTSGTSIILILVGVGSNVVIAVASIRTRLQSCLRVSELTILLDTVSSKATGLLTLDWV